MPSGLLVRLLVVLPLLIVHQLSGAPSQLAVGKTENMLLVTLDGLRWQELFGGADEKLMVDVPGGAEQRAQLRQRFHCDDELRRGRHFPGGEAIDSARIAVALNTIDGEFDITDGPYAETKEQLGGILLLEADDMQPAVELMSKQSGVKAVPFEIRPANEAINELIAARDAAVAKEE